MASNSLYPATSPYYTTGVVNNKFLDVMVDRPIPKLASDRYWTITQQYNLRPDMLAYDLYALQGRQGPRAYEVAKSASLGYQ